MKNSLLFIVFLSLISFSFAGNIEKGYEALRVFDYFSAKKTFTKALKKDSSAASHGLAIIYYNSDNPFHNYDSAFVCINNAVKFYSKTSEKKRLKWETYGFTIDSLLSLRQLISTAFYSRTLSVDNIEAYTNFIDVNYWANEVVEATIIRDSLAFEQCLEINTAEAYQLYLNTYLQSRLIDRAQNLFYEMQYKEETIGGDLAAYSEFIRSNSTSPYIKEAETKIYELVTESNTEEAFLEFLDAFPDNSLRDNVWALFYQKYISNYSKDRIEQFMEEFPSASNLENVKMDALLCDSTFLPFLKNGAYGFMNLSGIEIIDEKYQTSSFYSEGLVIVSKEEKYGVINKQDEVIIPFVYDAIGNFHNGLAIVELDEKYGIVDRNGRLILDCIYTDVSSFYEGMVYAELDERYGYYSATGELMIPHVFDDAYDFSEERAMVEVDGQIGFIDNKGNYLVDLSYEFLEKYADSLYVFKENNRFGLMNAHSEIKVAAIYSSIGNLKEGLAVAVLGESLIYLDSIGDFAFESDLSEYPNCLLKGEYVEGRAIAVEKGKYGRINTKGEEISKFKFENISLGTDVFPAQYKGTWSLYNTKSKKIGAAEYESIEFLFEGYFIASNNDSVGVISDKGNIIIPLTFNQITHLKNDLFLVEQEDLVGLYGLDSLIISIEYQKIGFFNENILYLSSGDEMSYYDLLQNKLIVLKDDE